MFQGISPVDYMLRSIGKRVKVSFQLLAKYFWEEVNEFEKMPSENENVRELVENSK